MSEIASFFVGMLIGIIVTVGTFSVIENNREHYEQKQLNIKIDRTGIDLRHKRN